MLFKSQGNTRTERRGNMSISHTALQKDELVQRNIGPLYHLPLYVHENEGMLRLSNN